MTPCGAPAPDTVRPEPDRQAKPGPPWRCMSPRTGACCVRRRCCASCPRSPWRTAAAGIPPQRSRAGPLRGRRRKHGTRPAAKAALVTAQPAVICARPHAQTSTPAPQPTPGAQRRRTGRRKQPTLRAARPPPVMRQDLSLGGAHGVRERLPSVDSGLLFWRRTG